MCLQKADAEKGLVASLGPTAQPASSTFVGQLLGPDSVMIPAPETGAPQPPRDPTIITVHDRKVRYDALSKPPPPFFPHPDLAAHRQVTFSSTWQGHHAEAEMYKPHSPDMDDSESLVMQQLWSTDDWVLQQNLIQHQALLSTIQDCFRLHQTDHVDG